jgi:phenylalanine-4-hydroxylase
MQEDGKVKAFGAGLMSSFSELQFAVESPDAHHVPFDIETVMRTVYEIDKFQRAYFVLPSFDALRDAFEAAVRELRRARRGGTRSPNRRLPHSGCLHRRPGSPQPCTLPVPQGHRLRRAAA